MSKRVARIFLTGKNSKCDKKEVEVIGSEEESHMSTETETVAVQQTKRIRRQSREAVKKHASVSRIFTPYRAIGHVANHVPFDIQVRGTQFLLTSCIGRAIQTYDVRPQALQLVKLISVRATKPSFHRPASRLCHFRYLVQRRLHIRSMWVSNHRLQARQGAVENRRTRRTIHRLYGHLWKLYLLCDSRQPIDGLQYRLT
jgi:hypothetical protein